MMLLISTHMTNPASFPCWMVVGSLGESEWIQLETNIERGLFLFVLVTKRSIFRSSPVLQREKSSDGELGDGERANTKWLLGRCLSLRQRKGSRKPKQGSRWFQMRKGFLMHSSDVGSSCYACIG